MTHDLLIIGGGINGCAIAREAALNGWSVLLVEKDDLAGHTSSASTKLIHGGLRYLETYEFGMVRKALKERALLRRIAPHIIRPMRIVVPHLDAIRPWWLVRAGLLIYDFLAGWPDLPVARGLRPSDAEYQAPFKAAMRGFVYSDCAVDDARLTILNAVDAAAAGAEICTRTAFVSAAPHDGGWIATLSDGSKVTARAIINAAGPWVSVVESDMGLGHRKPMKLVRGSHIVVPRLYEGDHAYMLQQPDKRIVFVINWVHGTTMIGTTEEVVTSPDDEAIGDGERTYLLDCLNSHFAHQLTAADVVHEWGGIRPLVDNQAGDARRTTRDYVLELETANAPSLTIYGGKITTARALAEDAIGKIAPVLGLAARPVTRDRALPVNVTPDSSSSRHPVLDTGLGSHVAKVESQAPCQARGDELGHGLTTDIVDWLVSTEWARTAEDILWRRTKLGLLFTAAQTAKLTSYLEAKHAARH